MNYKPVRDTVIVVLAFCATALAVPASAQGQAIDLFGTNLETRLKRQFKLTVIDLKRIRPLISRETENVARTYAHYSEERYRDNFLSLWDAVRSNRWEFETGLPTDLSSRQKTALRSARDQVESQVLDLWLDDYLDALAVVLELDRLQLTYVQAIFENETEKRRQMIIIENKRAVRLNPEWQRITDEREGRLRAILDDEQFRSYLSMGTPPPEGLIGE
jgi:hypothetical protein